MTTGEQREQALTPATLRREIKRAQDLGVSQNQIAKEARVFGSNLSAIVGNRQYLGGRRSARIQDALHRLMSEALAKQAAEEAAKAAAQEAGETPESAPKPQPGLRRL